ncbi:hypothetical protein, partial [Pseudomonas syringae group genomosp. 7]|uniref:hypothetical protein n=1 Tax=Pseudomonas syringae group genomosp. 7 TaxID=251699 RepID=UPI0037705C9A
CCWFFFCGVWGGGGLVGWCLVGWGGWGCGWWGCCWWWVLWVLGVLFVCGCFVVFGGGWGVVFVWVGGVVVVVVWWGGGGCV